MATIKINVEDIELTAELNDSDTARQILEALPLSGSANVWGDEIYFEIPVALNEAPDAQQEVEVGDLAYWPPGSAFCLFFGPTPVSQGNVPKAYSPVNPFGQIHGDARVLKQVSNGSEVRVEAA